MTSLSLSLSLDRCDVDHDSLQPRTAAYGGRHDGFELALYTCPACPYTITTIVAKKAPIDMTNVTTQDKLAVVTVLAAGRTVDFTVAANRHLTKLQVEAIAADAGYPNVHALRDAASTLKHDIDRERLQAVPDLPPPGLQPRPPAARMTTSGQPSTMQVDAAGEPMRAYDATAQLLLQGKESTSKRVQNLAGRIEDLLVDLRDRIRAEAKGRLLRDHQAAERKRLEAKARAEHEQLLADIAAAEEKVRELKARARGTRPVKTSTAPKNGGDRSRAGAAAKARHTYRAEFNARHGVTDAALRAWAAGQGIDVKQVGLLSRRILDAYDAAHPAPAAS